MAKIVVIKWLLVINSVVMWLVLQVAVSKRTRSPLPFIVNGTPAHQGQFPYMAAVMIEQKQACGAVVIGPRHILTAAHCLVTNKHPSLYEVYLGHTKLSPDRESIELDYVFAVEKLVPHEEYKKESDKGKSNYTHDIGLIVLRDCIDFQGKHKKVRIIPLQEKASQGFHSKKCLAIGWGLDEEDKFSTELMKLKIPILNDEKCRADPDANYDPSRQYCVGVPGGGAAVCAGDSGGPLLCWPHHDSRGVPRVLVGVTSFGLLPDEAPGPSAAYCAAADIPTYYTRVDVYLDWIHNQTKQFSCK